MSGGAPEVVRGLGLLPGSLSVHRDGEPRRWPFYRAAIAAGGVGPGYAADDGAALVFEGVSLVECVASRAGASVVHVSPDGGGGVREEPMPVRLLDDAADARAVPSRAVSELRELRAGGRRWV